MSSAHKNSNVDQDDHSISNSNKQKSRKRTRNTEQRKIQQQKLKVQSGLEHTTKSGQVVQAKQFCEQVECICNKRCAQKIDIDRQKAIFNAFYTLENWSKKTLFLRSLIKSRPKKENFNPVTAKNRTYAYFLTNNCGVQEEVCFRFFSTCFQIQKKKNIPSSEHSHIK